MSRAWLCSLALFRALTPYASSPELQMHHERQILLQVHNEDDRPEAGQALNRPAEVMLLNVYKRDKATGDPQKDPASVDAYVRRLKKLAAKQSSRFLDYDVQGGVWRFEVEHFSRYCVPFCCSCCSRLCPVLVARAWRGSNGSCFAGHLW